MPSGPLRCSLSWCASCTCCPVCCSSSAWPPLPWYVTALWVWPWWLCWRGPSSATLDGTAASGEPSTKLQVSSWNRCVVFGQWHRSVGANLWLVTVSLYGTATSPVQVKITHHQLPPITTQLPSFSKHVDGLSGTKRTFKLEAHPKFPRTSN